MHHCLAVAHGVSLGMLELSGAERRHEVRRVMFMKSLSGGWQSLLGHAGVREQDCMSDSARAPRLAVLSRHVGLIGGEDESKRGD